MLRSLFIDGPAFIVTLWYRTYIVLICFTCLVSTGTLLVIGLMALLGIRWGW